MFIPDDYLDDIVIEEEKIVADNYFDSLTRKHKEEKAEAEALHKLLLLVKTESYVGNLTRPEREDVFTKTVRGRQKTVNGFIQRMRQPFNQNPYDNKSWRSEEQLKRVVTPGVTGILQRDDIGIKSTEFDSFYSVKTQGIKIDSYSRPEIFLVQGREQNSESFKQVLYGDEAMLMKLTPLISEKGHLVDKRMINQIYNEIRTQYFLNELIYGYTNVLSVHFSVLIDWFQTSRYNLVLENSNVTTDRLYSQATISEYSETDFGEFMIAHATLDTLRAVIFQVFHAIEIAWHTNRFIHYDLHPGNVRMKPTSYKESPFNGRNLLYARKDMPYWYVLNHEHLGDHIVKIIDFGFSRMNVPTKPLHTLERGGQDTRGSRHVHDEVINGLDTTTGANRFTDVKMFLLQLLDLPITSFWSKIPDEDKKVFFRFAEDVLDFAEINRRIDLDLLAKRERSSKANGVLRASNVSKCPECVDLLTNSKNSYVRGYATKGMNVTDALDHPFFKSLTRIPNESNTKTGKDMVVSFLTDTDEEEMLTSFAASPFTSNETKSLRCEVCRRSNAQHYSLEEEAVPLCGALCAEFRYLYNGKTVFR